MISNEERKSLCDSGISKINWAYKNMPVLREIEKDFIKNKPFIGTKISISVHVEAKTANLAKLFVKGGAQVWITGCNPLSTQDDVAAALSIEDNINVFCKYGANKDEYLNDLLSVLKIKPNIIIDDGGDLAYLIHSGCKAYMSELYGGCEETTTGVIRLRNLEKKDALLYPSIAVNDARCKHLFDNRYGTGQSTLTALMSTTNLLIADKYIVIAGYGMCGKGIAMRAKGMGAKVIITEIDPVKSCEALMDGFSVMTMKEAARIGNIFITVTGCKDVITKEHINVMKDGAILSNAGHFDVEININDLIALSTKKIPQRKNIDGYIMKDGRTINLIAEGRLVNLASGDGHPAEIMDMSFAIQALSAEYLLNNHKTLENKVYDIPELIDFKVANLLLKSKNITIDKLTDKQFHYLNNWDL